MLRDDLELSSNAVEEGQVEFWPRGRLPEEVDLRISLDQWLQLARLLHVSSLGRNTLELVHEVPLHLVLQSLRGTTRRMLLDEVVPAAVGGADREGRRVVVRRRGLPRDAIGGELRVQSLLGRVKSSDQLLRMRQRLLARD